MKKIIVFLVLCFFLGPSYGQNSFRGVQKIDRELVNRLTTLFFKECYKECIDSCKYYLGYSYARLGYEKHPYREWNNYFYRPCKVEDVADVLYIGASAAYKYSLVEFDTKSIFNGIEWSRTCANLCNDYLQEKTPDESWPVDDIVNYVLMGEKGAETIQYGEHFLHIMIDDKWAKKEGKWFDKTGNRIYETLRKKLSGLEENYSTYPLLQYKISTISTAPSLNKGIFREYRDIFTKRLKALTNLIQHNQDNSFDSDIHIALHSLTTMLTNTVIENEICKKVGDNYERFCMENLIKLQDISYHLSGSSRYSQNPDYSLQDIQNCLEDTDCAIIHFEAPVTSGHLYYRYDLGTRYRNYALIITKDQIIPDVWHRGYIKDDKVNDLSKIKETYPNAKRFYFVGTPRMSFIDIAGTDASIVRLHSLSQLLYGRVGESSMSEITFVGDINYQKDIELTSTAKSKGAIVDDGKFEQLYGPAIELEQLKKLFGDNHIRPVIGDNATKNVVVNEITRSKDVIHISTHGARLDADDDFKPQDLILKKNVLDNSRLILSGYNDAPNSPMTSVSGSDVLNINKIDTSVVFLDACSSGSGAVGASGSVGISEAFHLIGAKNIICYLEPVEDGVATQFSNNFYTELSKGASCHDAFFKAKKSIARLVNVVLWE